MNHQARRAQIQDIVDKIDDDIAATIPRATELPPRPHPVATQPKQEPVPFGEPERQMIDAVVDKLTQNISGKINALRERLDDIEQQALAGAADAKASLNEQIIVCIRINDEITHMGAVIEELAARGRDE